MIDNTMILSISQSLNKLSDTMRVSVLEINVIQEIFNAVYEINSILYHTSKTLFFDASVENVYVNQTEFADTLNTVVKVWEKTLSRRLTNSIDAKFWDIYEYFKYVDSQTIYENAVSKFMSYPDDYKDEFIRLPQRYTYLKETINHRENDFSLIRKSVDVMVENVENYKWLYETLEDYRSKKILNTIINYWFEYDSHKLHLMKEYNFTDYFDLDIVDCSDDEVMVDCGAYTGDSVLNFVETYGKYKRVYAFEMTPGTYNVLKENTTIYDNIVCINKAVGDKREVIYINDTVEDAGNSIDRKGNIPIEIVLLDEEIKESISLIKMDIEGAEKDAINGARRHIANDKPKLLISAYHTPADIFDIPLLINEIRDDYKFYLRLNGMGIWPCDYVISAV